MRKPAALLFTAFYLLVAWPLLAQKIKVESGSLGFLKGEKVLNVEYVYDGLSVGKETEQAYTERKVSEYNKKEPGTGEKWLASWKADRAKRFEPKFEELLNKQFSERKIDFTVGKNPEASFTMVVKTTALEPGWNAALVRRSAEVTTMTEFFPTKDRTKSLARVSILRAPGRDVMGFDFDVGWRYQEGYAKTGKELGILLVKKALK